LRTRAGRAGAFRANLERLRRLLEEAPGVAVVRDLAGYRRARAAGRHAAFLCVQGGHALDDPDARAAAGDLVAVTLVHLTSSSLGGTSSPLRHLTRTRGLTRRGAELVEWLDAQRTFVDLAHIDREGFMAAADVHDRRLPLAVTHTGVAGVYPHWRNIDDEQLRRVADTGGVVGIIYEPGFLGPPGARGLDAIVSHLEHVARVAGEDAPALGSDWDGAISTPPEMPTCLELPRLVQRMLDRGFGVERVRRVLGGNYLRALGELRPGGP
jgi:membrane dipeptidase